MTHSSQRIVVKGLRRDENKIFIRFILLFVQVRLADEVNVAFCNTQKKNMIELRREARSRRRKG